MLRPRIYPEMMGKALVLEAEPFITMVDDDEPWAEGLFFTVCVGLLVGIARVIGGLLTTATMPPTDVMLEAILRGMRQAGLLDGGGVLSISETIVRQDWHFLATMLGVAGGWLRLYILVAAPFLLVVQWLLVGGVGYVAARQMGGRGSFSQTLGATALIAAPSALYVVSIAPFASVSGLLLFAWGLLITYRALEVAQDLPWQKAAVAAVIPLLVQLLILLPASIWFLHWLLQGGAV
ncbi:MAG: YIP1 family protein [Caldilineaceae bacterium]|nr:YIP1 family protein [Caldilineaceae bacterium]MCB0141847.1 YIP1 family protein [Caldilineaceae bacterium]